MKIILYSFFLSFFLLTSCTDYDSQLPEVEPTPKKEYSDQIFQSFTEKDYELLFENEKGNNKSIDYSSLLDFENASSFYSDEVNTYTIPLKGSNTNKFKNLVLLEYPDATFSIVISYENDGKRTKVKSIKSAYNEDDMMVSSSNCYDTYTYSETNCNGGGNHPPGDPQCGCYDEENNCTPGYATVYVSRNCGGGDEGGDGDGDDPYPPGPTLPNPPGTIEDPLQDEYIDCVTNTLRTDCWVFCEAVNCTTGDQEKYDLANNLDLTPLEANWLFANQQMHNEIETVLGSNTEYKLDIASTFVKISYKYQDFRNENVSILDFQSDPEKFLAAATFYEAFQEGYIDNPIDPEDLQFYLEFFQKELLPLGITFIPYGIGDAADIFQSCNNKFGWNCAFAIAGILVPVDELIDIFRKLPEIKAAWKVVNNLGQFKQAWKFLKNTPKSIRTDPNILDGVRKALNRGVKSVDDMVQYAGVNYINSSTIQHIFRGDNTPGGGIHHIAALLSDGTKKITSRTPTSSGCYKANILKADGTTMYNKDFFPDTWDEEKVIDELKNAWQNKVDKSSSWGSGTYLGESSDGVPIYIKVANGKIKTAYPRWN